MCGIVGLLNIDGKPVDDQILLSMTKAIRHRGPTGFGSFIQDQVGLGNSRLAIIDLEFGNQPLSNEDGKIWITYNGELYNYRELRQQLKVLGHIFRTNSDTETIVHAYESWGEKCVENFRGMFSFAIVDLSKKLLFIARDHFGIKPLFFIHTERYFAFASELQALRCIPSLPVEMDLQALDQYLFLQYIPAPKTIFQHIKKLPPAHRLSISFNGECTGPERYWEIQFNPDEKRTEGEWIEAADSLLRDSVKAHLISDVPFGAFLSGGIDSSAVVTYMSQVLEKPVKTFTIAFDEDAYNEEQYAQQVAKRWNTEHHIEFVRPDALKILPKLVKNYGEPFGDSSSVPTYYVSQMAEKYVPMVLSGDGGDEFFGGYQSYLSWLSWLTGLGKPWWKKFGRNILQGIMPYRYPQRIGDLKTWYSLINYLNFEQRTLLWRPEYRAICKSSVEVFDSLFEKARGYSYCNQAQFLDIGTYLPFDILTKVDIASMIHGLEVRTPLVDIRVAEFAATIPDRINLRVNSQGKPEGKLLLKKVLKKYFPEEFLHRQKMGFAIPLKDWFSTGTDFHQKINSMLLEHDSKILEFFEPTSIENLINENNPGPLWLFLFLNEWLRQFQESN